MITSSSTAEMKNGNSESGLAVCVLVNRISGSREGIVVEEFFKSTSLEVRHVRVFDILSLLDRQEDNQDFELPYKQFKDYMEEHLENGLDLVVIAAGGDGSIKLAIEIVHCSLNMDSIPISILPLGTGNELAKCVGWKTPSSFTQNSLEKYVTYVLKRNEVALDLWNLRFEKGDIVENRVMSCFFSIGFDANIAKKFHVKRLSSPKSCSSRIENKLWHVLYGIEEAFNKDTLQGSIFLKVRGEDTPLSRKARSVQLFNIHRYLYSNHNSDCLMFSSADGVDFWQAKQKNNCNDIILEEDRVWPTINDGILEVCSTDGIVDMNKTRLELGHSTRIAQIKNGEMEIYVNEDYPAQLDGEPFIIEAGTTIKIEYLKLIHIISGPGPKKNVEAPNNLPITKKPSPIQQMIKKIKSI